jgi:hypothetical protein
MTGVLVASPAGEPTMAWSISVWLTNLMSKLLRPIQPLFAALAAFEAAAGTLDVVAPKR